MVQLPDIPDRYPATAFKRFNPQYEFGFPIQNLPRARSREVENLAPLSTQEACSLFHNFNGVDVSMSISTQNSAEGEGSSYTAQYVGPVTLRNIVQPRDRYAGYIVNPDIYAGHQDSDGGLVVRAYVFDPTQMMTMYFNNRPPQGNYFGLRGFGVKLFEAEISGRVSRYSGGTTEKVITLANYDARPSIGYYRVWNKQGTKQITVNVWDGSYQAYRKSTATDARLIGELTATNTHKRKVLTDPNGTRISLTLSEATVQSQGITVEYDDEGKIEDVGYLNPPIANFEMAGGGRFFSYG